MKHLITTLGIMLAMIASFTSVGQRYNTTGVTEYHLIEDHMTPTKYTSAVEVTWELTDSVLMMEYGAGPETWTVTNTKKMSSGKPVLYVEEDILSTMDAVNVDATGEYVEAWFDHYTTMRKYKIYKKEKVEYLTTFVIPR